MPRQNGMTFRARDQIRSLSCLSVKEQTNPCKSLTNTNGNAFFASSAAGTAVCNNCYCIHRQIYCSYLRLPRGVPPPKLSYLAIDQNLRDEISEPGGPENSPPIFALFRM